MLNLKTVMALTGWSKRTLWRRLSNGVVMREEQEDDGKATKISFDEIKEHICIPLIDEDFKLIQRADNGDVEAQIDLAVIFLENKKYKGAIYWLELAAEKKSSEAMHLMGICYLQGNGVFQDENLGIMWLAKAASYGHLIAKEQINSLTRRALATPPNVIV